MNITQNTVILTDWGLISAEIFIGLAFQLLLIYGVVYGYSSKKPVNTKVIGYITSGVFVIALWLLLTKPVTTATVFGGTLAYTESTKGIQCLLLLIGLVVVILIQSYNTKSNEINEKKKKVNGMYEIYILLGLAITGMLTIVAAQDFLTFYLALEFQSFCLYIMAASKRTSEYSTESGLKYFILGALASGFFLFGGALLYGAIGSINFEDWSKLVTYLTLDKIETSEIININMVESMVVIGFTFIIFGFLFKLTAFPFHIWAPDVYEGAPTSVTALFALLPKAAILAIFGKLLSNVFYPIINFWQPVLAVVAIGSVLIGVFGALGQRKLKRLLAFSAISHMGYMLMGFASGTTEGFQATYLYLIIYLIITSSLFAFLIGTHNIKSIHDLAGLGKEHPALAFVWTITFFSLAGIPPLGGFFSKYYVFLAALSADFMILALVGVITSTIGAFYYLRIVKTIYFHNIPTSILNESKNNSMGIINSQFNISFYPAIILSISFVFILTFFFFPAPFLTLALNFV